MPELLLEPNNQQIEKAKRNIGKLLKSPIGDPKKIVVILTSSRGGSSCLFDILSRSPNVVSLQGEIEPYLKLTDNALNDDYFSGNRLDNISSISELRALVRGTLSHKHNSIDTNLINALHIRSILQWPEKESEKFSVSDAYTSEQSWYDGKLENNEYKKRKVILEEPPFVIPNACSYPASLNGKVVLFKTPQNVYRPSLFRELFPRSEIQYIHLKRSFAATVNGLMDGWLHKRAFFAYRVGGLNIRGYYYTNWWCFDLYPGWYEDKNKSLIAKLSYKFEDIVDYPKRMVYTICSDIGIEPPNPIDMKITMATNSPQKYRWYKRKEEIMRLSKRVKVRTIMKQLSYSMNPNDWT